MKSQVSKFLDNILSEAAMDSRIDDGIIDVYNIDHLDVIAEHMKSHGLDESVINEFVEKVIATEGKYPERQAFNKDGWLVTFPSKEYRDAAIKKGTHSIADPTHGKGGMNLYYKRKGKQKRQVKQATTKIAPEVQPPTQPPAPVQPTSSEQPQKSKKKIEPQPSKAPQKQPPQESPPEEEDYGAMDASEEDEMDKMLASKLGNLYKSKYNQPVAKTSEPAPQPQPTAPVQPQAAPQPVIQPAAKATEKFAMDRGWKGTPYGEWRDEAGNTVAITSPSGEITPIKTTDREELKLVLSKQNP